MSIGDNNTIPRCKSTFSEYEFYRLKNIHDENPWLAYENLTGFYELWNLTNNETQKELLEFLINNFTYVNLHELLNACKAIANQIEINWKLSPENTIITAISDNADPDGSQFLLQAMKNKFSFSWREAFYNAITNAVYAVKDDTNLVIIDDFIGSGNKVLKKVSYVQRTLLKKGIKDVNIYVCSLAAMIFSKPQLTSIVNNVFSYMWLNRGITELAPADKRMLYVKEMLALESHLHWTVKKQKMFSFGYKQSETLFSIMSTNVPNNVFPIFWWRYLRPNKMREPILRRL